MTRPELPYSASWTLADHVDRAAAAWGNREALVFGADRRTFDEFADATFELARSLLALGVGAGDAVGVALPNGVDALAALYGAARLGAVLVPLDVAVSRGELREIVPHADLRVLIAEAELADELQIADAPELRHVVRHGPGENPECISWAELRALSNDVAASDVRRVQRRMRASDTAMIVYAPPGTTDRPTGCRLSHEGLVRSGRVLGEQRFPMTEEDRQFNPLPLSGLGALQPFNGCLATGAAFVGMERFDAQEALALLMAERCTVAFPAVDRLWASVLDQPDLEEADLSQLWLAAVDGDTELLAAIAEVTPDVTQLSVYGCTEAGGLIALSHLDDPLETRIESAGRPFPGIELMIVDPDSGEPLDPGEEGEIAIRGWSLFQGYQKARSALDDAGFLHTGDHGSLDEHGRLYHLTSEREPLTQDE
jgi:fatty-acyl-CoA synthase